jgi:hypothetical protein
MKPKVLLSRKKILIYSLSILVLATSTYYIFAHRYILLPLEKRLKFFCALDDAHLTQEPVWIEGYWRNNNTEWVEVWACLHSDGNLTVIDISKNIDGYIGVYYCDTEDIFWIGAQRGPTTAGFYGPYEGILWKLTNDMTPLAGIIVSAIGIILSAIVLLYSLVRGASPRKNWRGN